MSRGLPGGCRFCQAFQLRVVAVAMNSLPRVLKSKSEKIAKHVCRAQWQIIDRVYAAVPLPLPRPSCAARDPAAAGLLRAVAESALGAAVPLTDDVRRSPRHPRPPPPPRFGKDSSRY